MSEAHGDSPAPRARRRSVALFFAGTTLVLASASPLWIAAMGYAGEELAACRQLLDGQPVAWPRNGAVSVAMELPLMALARGLGARTTHGEETVVAMAPVLATAGIAALLYAWAARLAGSRGWGFAIALAGTFGTMLWPYAYIGMETLQSLALLAAAYCALACPSEGRPSWRRSLAFGLLAGLSVAAKSIGFLLVPAAAYLWYRLHRRKEGFAGARALTSAAVAVVVFGLNLASRLPSWERFGGTAAYSGGWLVSDPITPFLHLTALLASPNKGLLVFAPLAVVGLLALPAAWRRDRAIAVFALLTLGGVAGGISLLGIWSDETWGPRYLHVAVPPLLLVFAASRAGRPLRLRSEAPFAAAAGAGLVVSALGVLFYYGTLVGAAHGTTTLTLESLQGDLTWNHPRFNARLLRVWLSGGTVPFVIRREKIWHFRDPNQPLIWRAFDVRPMAVPQPFVLVPATSAGERAIKWTCVLAAIAGLLLLSAAVRARDRPPGGIIPRA